jgi:hypothetical protein
VLPARQASWIRFARVMLRLQVAGMALGAAALVYVLGFGVPPLQVGYACLIAACYVVLTGIATFFTQQAWRAHARRFGGNAARDADGRLTTDNADGLAQTVRDANRSARRAYLSVTLLGLAMLIAFVVLVNHYEGQAMVLDSSGSPVHGVVTSVTGPGQRQFDRSVDVRYAYGGQTFDTRIYLNNNSPTYQAGEAVTVTLDSADPQIAAVGGSDNLGPGLVVLLTVLLLGGGAAFFIGFCVLVMTQLARWRRHRETIKLTTVVHQ